MQIVQKKYLELKKASKQIDIDFKKVMSDDFTENEWRKEGRKINLNINNFDNIKNFIKRKIEDDHLDSQNDDNIRRIQNYLEEVEREITPKTYEINKKTKNFAVLDEQIIVGGEVQNDPQGNLLIQDLANNQEVLEERRKQLETMHKTAAQIKDMSDAMVKQLDEQGAILDQVETNVNTAEENAKKAKAEITKANEMSKSNRKRMICFIVIIVVAVLGITGILLSLIL